MKRGRAIAKVALLLAVLGLLVWRLGRVARPEAPPLDNLEFPAVTSETVAPRDGYRAPDFDAADLQGRSVHLSALRGRAVFLNFWATWCVPCRTELPAIGRLAARVDKSAAIITIATDSKEPDVRAMMHARGVRFPVVFDGTGAIAARYEVTGIPTTLLLGPDGIVVKRIAGVRAWDHPDFVAWLGKLSRASSPGDPGPGEVSPGR